MIAGRSGLVATSLLVLSVLGLPGGALAYDEEEAAWQEDAVVFPEMPPPERMKALYVSPTATNRFFVDPVSLTVGGDGVIRYVMLVETAGGARNMTYEGLRCSTREKRIYATARRDGSWSTSRNEAWEKIRDIPPNRQHAALYSEYFCPGGFVVRNPDEARRALAVGGIPSHGQW